MDKITNGKRAFHYSSTKDDNVKRAFHFYLLEGMKNPGRRVRSGEPLAYYFPLGGLTGGIGGFVICGGRGSFLICVLTPLLPSINILHFDDFSIVPPKKMCFGCTYSFRHQPYIKDVLHEAMHLSAKISSQHYPIFDLNRYGFH